MVVVRYLILCSKFAKIVCRPGSARTRWGSLQRSPRLPSWITGGGRRNGDGRTGGWQGGEEGSGREEEYPH